jgi:hypothetical protein
MSPVPCFPVQANVVALNKSLEHLGQAGRVSHVEQLLAAMREAGRTNSFTWACAFQVSPRVCDAQAVCSKCVLSRSKRAAQQCCSNKCLVGESCDPAYQGRGLHSCRPPHHLLHPEADYLH